ncbi:MAG: type I DNA topoisomerase [gamma proteobacterium symbiont of Lucinoma myriamae]|nr:type I DNA topoisomerase [gamma proteobacterium symbiont of Lucinoma myriamae]MCU7832114.1 type I DNA topoisomerase [gamma proteobacterium symbiont of Lucinoma myriamae]
MGKSLVIVESPAKAKTINKYLGKDFIVKSSVGHIRDLPTSGSSRKTAMTPKERAKLAAQSRKLPPEEREKRKKERAQIALIERMGIDPENGWNPHYETMPGKEKVITDLKKFAKTSDTIYLATDLDREGEAIAWHLKETLGDSLGKNSDIPFKRVVFNEITEKAIHEAFATPGELNMDHVNAQQTRRFLDRVVGYMVSPLLWKKVARGLSAGRVQSVAVKLVVEREREIHAFNPQEYWEVYADLLTSSDDEIKAQVLKYQGNEFRPTNKADTDSALKALVKADYTLSKRETRATSSRPRAPFITSTLQQAASTRMGFGVKKTMMLAQRLYEAGYITYMRTDSTNLSAEAVASGRDYIQSNFGKKYLPEKAIVYSSKGGAQEAHDAIRPSDVNISAMDVNGVDRDAQRLYELIWRQFLACQMTPAKYENTTLTISAADYDLKLKGRSIIFDGWTRVMKAIAKSAEEIILPLVKEGEQFKLQELLPAQHFTKPPARFSEASLVKELEKRGIGRPSTYASIISTIQDRGYVTTQNKRFYAEKIGAVVTERLCESFHELMTYSFTSDMEEKLDAIASSEKHWKDVLDAFYQDFKAQLNKADGDGDEGMRANDPTPTDIPCPDCGRHMMVRTGSTGIFLGCSGYSLPPKERCKGTLNLIPGDEAVDTEQDDEGEAKALIERKRCPKCDTSMDSYLIDEQRKLHICGDNPDCDGFIVEQGQYRIKGYDGPLIECDKCGSDMQLKSGRFGKYFGCTNDDCKNTRKLLRNGEAAPPKADPIHMKELPCEKSDGYFVFRDGAAGVFMASSAFPRSRETRAPLISELLPHKDELDPKFLYLIEAPVEDNKGNPVMIRFSRKNKEQYVMTENKEGKATGWTAHYRDGKWDIELPKPKKKAAKKKAVKKKAVKKKAVKKKAFSKENS